MNKPFRLLALLSLLVSSLVLGAAGCASSTMGPGAGAAQSTVKGSVNDTSLHALNVFKDMNIQVVGDSIQDSGKVRELTGKMGETTIKVVMQNTSNELTSVEVDATNNIVNGKKDVAQNILDKIIQQA